MAHVRPAIVCAAARWLLGLAPRPAGLTATEHEEAAKKAEVVLRARERLAARATRPEPPAKDEPPQGRTASPLATAAPLDTGSHHASHPRKKEHVLVAAVLDDGTIVLSRPAPTGTYADGEHVRLRGVEFPKIEAFARGDPRNRLQVNVEARSLMAAIVSYLRGQTPGLENEGIVGRHLKLTEVAERTDRKELQGDLYGLEHEPQGYTIGHRDFDLAFTLRRLFPVLRPKTAGSHHGSPSSSPPELPPLPGGVARPGAGGASPPPSSAPSPPAAVADALGKMALRAEYFAKLIGQGEKGKAAEVVIAKGTATRTATAIRHLSEKPENGKAQAAVLSDAQEMQKAALLLAPDSDDRKAADEVATMAALAYKIASTAAPGGAVSVGAVATRQALVVDVEELVHLFPTEAKELHKLASHLATTLRHGVAAKILEAKAALARAAQDLPAESLERGVAEAVLADADQGMGAALPAMGAAPMGPAPFAGAGALTDEERRTLHDSFASLRGHLAAMPHGSALRPFVAWLALAVHAVARGRGDVDGIGKAADQLERAAGLFPEASTDRLHADAAVAEARKLLVAATEGK